MYYSKPDDRKKQLIYVLVFNILQINGIWKMVYNFFPTDVC